MRQNKAMKLRPREGSLLMSSRNTLPYGYSCPHTDYSPGPLDEKSVLRAQAKEAGRQQTFQNACDALWEYMPLGYTLEKLKAFDPPRSSRIDLVETQLQQIWGLATEGRATHMEFRKALEAWYRGHLNAFRSWSQHHEPK